jgi:hypothetical protein
VGDYRLGQRRVSRASVERQPRRVGSAFAARRARLLALTPGVAQAVVPPLMWIVCAVIHCASGVQRNVISGTISSNSPSRPAPLIRLAAWKDRSVSTSK